MIIKRTTKYILIAVLMLIFVLSFAACGGDNGEGNDGDGDTFTVASIPQNLTATAGNGQVTLSWQAPTSDGGSAITKYEVKYQAGFSSQTFMQSPTNTEHTFTDLSNGVKYTFSVCAVNAKGNSEAATASATPKQTEVQLPTPTIEFDEIDGIVFWAADPNAEGYTLTINNETQTFTSGNYRVELKSFGVFGDFTVMLTALGGRKTDTTIYIDSQIAEFSGTYREGIQLTTPTIEFDEGSGIVYWTADTNASGYVLTVNNIARTAVLNAGKYEYQLATYAEFDITLTALGGKQTNTASYIDSKQAARMIDYAKLQYEEKPYIELEKAVNLRIGNVLKDYDAYMSFNSTTGQYDIDLLIGADGKVYATWYSVFYSKMMFEQYSIPIISYPPNPDIDEWISRVEYMSVPAYPSVDSFTDFGTLSITDAQILFDFALNQSGGQADKALLKDAKVAIVKEAKNNLSNYSFKQLIKASGGDIYECEFSFLKAGTSTLYDFIASPSKNSIDFVKGFSFTPADSLLPKNIPYENYQKLVKAVNLRIGSQTGSNPQPEYRGGLYDMQIVIDTNGKVYATWYMYGFSKTMYAEYQIPLTADQIANPNIDEWIAKVASMTVPQNPSMDNFTETGELSLDDAQILFYRALMQMGNTTNQSLLRRAEVKMVTSAQNQSSDYAFSMVVLAEDGKMYKTTLTFSKHNTYTLYDVVDNEYQEALHFEMVTSLATADKFFKY